MATFTELGISESLQKALRENNIQQPTEIQEKAIPFLLEKGTDLIAQAQTGTGKTAAFGLPILQRLNPSLPHVQALVLAPTRELCQQIAKQLFKFTKYGPKLFTESVYGGAPIGDQIKALQRPTQIVVATPGRLIDLLERQALELSHIQTIVLDEADEMLSMGFKKELDEILSHTRGKRHTWLFSATMPAEIKSIIKNYMAPDAYHIEVNKKHVVNKDIDHRYMVCDEKEKPNMLLRFLKGQDDDRGIVFCKTKANAQTLAKQLTAKNYPAGALHGDLQQRERDTVMRAFINRQEFQTLIATDIAARGLDIRDLNYVVHYQLPEQIEYYPHRRGRTARAGKKGVSLCLVTPAELKAIQELEKLLGIRFTQI